MARTMIRSLLYYCLLSSVNVWAQNSIGLRAASNLRGILLELQLMVNIYETIMIMDNTTSQLEIIIN